MYPCVFWCQSPCTRFAVWIITLKPSSYNRIIILLSKRETITKYFILIYAISKFNWSNITNHCLFLTYVMYRALYYIKSNFLRQLVITTHRHPSHTHTHTHTHTHLRMMCAIRNVKLCLTELYMTKWCCFSRYFFFMCTLTAMNH